MLMTTAHSPLDIRFVAPETKYPVYPAGPSFIAQARRDILNLSYEEDDKIQAKLHHEKLQAKAIEAGEELYPGLGEEVEEKHVLAYDPKEWKVSSDGTGLMPTSC
jgi:DnaJ family protein C protein 2